MTIDAHTPAEDSLPTRSLGPPLVDISDNAGLLDLLDANDDANAARVRNAIAALESGGGIEHELID